MKRYAVISTFLVSLSARAQVLVNVLTDGSVCELSFVDQQREAIRILLKNAEEECGSDLVPIQLSETVLVEGHSCLNYKLGAYAEAYFKCVALTASGQR